MTFRESQCLDAPLLLRQEIHDVAPGLNLHLDFGLGPFNFTLAKTLVTQVLERCCLASEKVFEILVCSCLRSP